MRPGVLRFLNVTLVVVLATVSVYAVLLVIKVSKGYSRTQETPEYTVRLEVVDASGVKGFARRVKKEISEHSDMTLEVQVVRTVPFDLRDIPETMLIARDEDKQDAARELARRIGLNPDEVDYRPLANNTDQIGATLVLGSLSAEQLFLEPTYTEN